MTNYKDIALDCRAEAIRKQAQKDLLEKFEEYNNSQTIFDKKLDDFIERQKLLINK